MTVLIVALLMTVLSIVIGWNGLRAIDAMKREAKADTKLRKLMIKAEIEMEKIKERSGIG